MGKLKKEKTEKGRRVAILPSLFTVANMLCGWGAIIWTLKGNIDIAVWFIIVAVLLDGMDGRIARMIGATSDFGKELDSLSDFLSFGVAPAFMVYQWGLFSLGRVGWLGAFLFIAGGALRLARFNVMPPDFDKTFFLGMPIPAAAGALVTPLWYLTPWYKVPPPWLALTALAWLVLLALLMVSPFTYLSFKDLDLRQRRPSLVFFLVVLLMVVIALNPRGFFFGFSLSYMFLTPVTWVWNRLFHRKQKAQVDAEASIAPPS